MKTETWTAGSNKSLDTLFNQLREEQYQDKSHRYWKNYGTDSMSFAVALTICFDDLGNPELCSSIAKRDCWPEGAYRIMNRTWKHSNRIAYPRKMSPSFGFTARSQQEWLEKNTDYQLMFISRQTNNWQQFTIDSYRQPPYDIIFKKDNYKYLTCPNECDATCWQSIIYQGNDSLLLDWKRQC